MRDLTDAMDRWWTIDQAAAHLKVKRATVEKYIRDGLTLHFPKLGGYLDRDELLADYRGRQGRSRATRAR